MPFLEFIGVIFIIVFAVVFATAGAMFMASAFAAILCFVLMTGWIPILMCATDPSFAIGFEHGIVGTWAAFATIAYVLSSLGVIVLWFVEPDPDGLPPAWKFLSNFYTYTPAATAKSSIHTSDRSWDTKTFSDSLNEGAPSWGHHKATSAAQMHEQSRHARQEASRLKRENDKREKEIKEAAELAEAMMDLEREKARREGLKDTEGYHD